MACQSNNCQSCMSRERLGWFCGGWKGYGIHGKCAIYSLLILLAGNERKQKNRCEQHEDSRGDKKGYLR